MSPELIAARDKQSARGNDPKSTACTAEERMDHGFYRTGFYYRKWLDNRLSKGMTK